MLTILVASKSHRRSGVSVISAVSQPAFVAVVCAIIEEGTGSQDTENKKKNPVIQRDGWSGADIIVPVIWKGCKAI